MEALSCLLPSTFRKNGRDKQPSFSFFIFQTLQGITGLVESNERLECWTVLPKRSSWPIYTGVMIIIVMSVIYVFASQRSRRRQHRFEKITNIVCKKFIGYSGLHTCFIHYFSSSFPFMVYRLESNR